MSIEKPPTPEELRELIQNRPQEDPDRKKKVRGLLLGLVVLVLLLGVVDLATSDVTQPLRGMGNVSGIVLDGQENPLLADIFVEGTSLKAKANPDGSFLIKDVPAGERLMVVADGANGREIAVTVLAGQTADLGKVQIKVTQTP